MNDKMLWKRPYARLLKDLGDYWRRGQCGGRHGPDPDQQHGVQSFVYGYSSFSGAFNGLVVRVTIDTFDHGGPALSAEEDYVEVLCLNVRVPLDGFITFKQREFHERRLSSLSSRFECRTGNPELDSKYVIEARHEQDRELVENDSFKELIGRLDPFATFGVEDSGLRLSIPIENEKQVGLDYVVSRWETMTELATQVQRAYR